MKRLATFFVFCSVAAIPAVAQSHFTGYVGGGFTEPMWDVGTRLNRGWNVTAGAGVNVQEHVGMMVDFMFNDLGINQTTLNNVQAPNGSARIWALTLDPVIHTSPHGPVDFYITGGGGLYHRTVEFTQPAVATVTLFDPYFGVLYPAAVPTNEVIGSFSNFKGGLNGGAGVEFKLGSSNVKMFAEAKYHHMFTRPTPTVIIPVSFGFRW
jgi:opacity protein-like surface antigen